MALVVMHPNSAEFRIRVLESTALLRSAVLRRPCWRQQHCRFLWQDKRGHTALSFREENSVYHLLSFQYTWAPETNCISHMLPLPPFSFFYSSYLPIRVLLRNIFGHPSTTCCPSLSFSHQLNFFSSILPTVNSHPSMSVMTMATLK